MYEADGQTRSIAYANGVTTAFTYSPQRRWLTAFETKQANGTVLLAGTNTRDDAGRITVIGGPAPADDWTYAYDHLDQLLTADNAGDNTLDETFVYSTTGNLISRTRLGQVFTYPAATDPRPHAPTLLGATPIGYDANGNMVSDGARAGLGRRQPVVRGDGRKPGDELCLQPRRHAGQEELQPVASPRGGMPVA